MSYFKNFRTITYNGVDLVDITQRTVFFSNLKNTRICAAYNIQDGETPQSLAQDFYGDPELDWTIIGINGMIDPIRDWPMESNTFESYLQQNFDNPDDVLFYTDPQTNVIYNNTTDATLNDVPLSRLVATTIREYYEAQNESRRRIVIINKENISTIVTQFQELMKNSQALS